LVGVASGNREAAAAGHGVSSIDGEIGDDLLELGRIAQQPGLRGTMRRCQLDVGTQVTTPIKPTISEPLKIGTPRKLATRGVPREHARNDDRRWVDGNYGFGEV
jgi:hypothetical protein